MVTYDERQDLIATEVTLNGFRAKLMGAKMDYARLSCLDPDMPLSVEYSWDTAKRIVENDGGHFYTSAEAERATKREQAAKLKPAKRQAASKAPVLDFDLDQLDVLLQAADCHLISLRAKQAVSVGLKEQSNVAALQTKINLLKVSIHKLHGLLYYLKAS